MKKRLMALVLILTVLIGVGSVGTVLADSLHQAEDTLAERVLQEDDLSGSEGYSAAKVAEDRFPGSPNFGNIPMQAKGFREAYEVNAFLPADSGESGAFVLNLAYQYEDRTQAEAAFEQWLDYLGQAELSTDTEMEAAEQIEALATAKGMRGHALRFTYESEGTTWQTHYLLGIRDDTLILLMVDGLPSAAAQEKFDALATIIIER